MSTDYLFKLVIVGESGVGKTAMLLRFAEDKYDKTYLSTIGVDFKVRTLMIDEKHVKLQIWDTAGQEMFRNTTTSYYRDAAGIIIVYDITSHDSFDKVSDWIQDVQKIVPNVPIMIIGNKCDLEEKRQVPLEEGRDMGARLNLVFLETSAKDSINIDQAFTEMAQRCLKENPVPRPRVNLLDQPKPKKEDTKKSQCSI